MKRSPLSALTITGLLALFLVVTALPALANNESSTPQGWVAPVSAQKIQNPLPASNSVIKTGKKIFAQQCAVCHGASGRGDGPTAQYLGKKLPDFSSPEFTHQTDGEIFWKMSNGNAPMPTFKEILTEEQRWQLVNFIRTFASDK